MLRRFVPRRLRHGEEATLTEHLGELRHRLVLSMLAIVPAFGVAFAFHSPIIDWLRQPLPDDKEDQLITLGVIEPFTNAVKVSVIVAIAVTLPILLWQIWGFLAPAVTEQTQRLIAGFVVFATTLFAGGVAFAYTIVLPSALEFLTSFDEELYNEQIRASFYFSFVTMVLLATGLAFQMPIFILALVRIGVFSSATLRKNRRIGVVLMVIFAILLPTVDPVSLAFETIPLLALFELSIWLSVWMERRLGLTSIAQRWAPDDDGAPDDDDGAPDDDDGAPDTDNGAPDEDDRAA